MTSLSISPRRIYPSDKTKGTLSCPTCKRTHHAKTDVFGNIGKNLDFDAREIFIKVTCPICLEECSPVVALPCGHILCKADYQRLGGFVRSVVNDDDDNESPENVILRIHRSGVNCVNGTYQYDTDKGRFTRLGVWDGKDSEFSVETRAVNGKKMWCLCCRIESSPDVTIDFYKAQVVDSSCYPSQVRWHSAGLHGIQPHPRIEVSYFE
jgi:hypothetical protein